MLNSFITILKFALLFLLLLFRDIIGSFILETVGLTSQSYGALLLGGFITLAYLYFTFYYINLPSIKLLFTKVELSSGIKILMILTIALLKAIPLVGMLLIFHFLLQKEVVFQLPLGLIETIFYGTETVLFGPLVEELSFRGIIFSRLRKNASLFVSLIVSSTLFTLLHSGSFAIIFVFILGLVLAFVYEKTKSLRYPLFLHIALNLLTFLGRFISFI